MPNQFDQRPVGEIDGVKNGADFEYVAELEERLVNGGEHHAQAAMRGDGSIFDF